MADSLTAEEALNQTYSDSTEVVKVVSAPIHIAFQKFHEFVWLKNAGKSQIIPVVLDSHPIMDIHRSSILCYVRSLDDHYRVHDTFPTNIHINRRGSRVLDNHCYTRR